MKKLVSTLMATILVISMGITGFAQEQNQIKVVLDGKQISFNQTAPIEKEGRVMVPFASIFEAMGATVKYEDKTIIATLENKEIRIKENSNTAELITDGKAEVIDMKVPAFVQDGRSYVPVSTISLGFGYDVYWDNYTKTVNVINAQKLIDEIDAKYTIYNKMMSTEQVDMEKTYKTTMDGNLNMNLGKDLTGTEEEMILAAKANLEAISKGMNLSTKGSIKVDTTKSNMTDMMGEDEKMLENIPFEIIMNSDQGKFYINVPMEIEGDKSLENTWMEMTIDPTTAIAIDQLKTSMTGKTELTIGQIVYQVAWSMKDTLPMLGMDVYSYAKQMDQIYEIVMSDDLFTTTTQGNKTTHNIDMNKTQIIAKAIQVFGIQADSADMKEVLDMIDKLDYKMEIVEVDNKLSDISLEMNMSMKAGEEKMEMNISVKGNQQDSDMKMKMTIGDTKFEMDFKSVSVETNQTVQTAPPAGSNIIDMTQMMNNTSAIGIIGGADGPTAVAVESTPEMTTETTEIAQ